MALLERENSLAALQSGINRAFAGTGHVCVVTGEAGVGKTFLVEAFISDFGNRCRLLRGACEDLSVAEPLGPLLDLARDANWNLPVSTERGTRLALFSQALENFSALAPAALVIEDLHWADDATLDFVRFVARRIRNTGLCLIVTARNDEEGGRMHLRRAFADTPAGQVTRVPISPLSRHAVSELAGAAGRSAAEIYRVTGGNAFFVSEMLSNSAEQVPEGARESVLARADRLTIGARKVLNAVSLFPRRAEISLALELCGKTFNDDLEECISRGLLVQAGDYVNFRHELARQAVEEAVPAAQKKELSAQLFFMLSMRPEIGNARLLHHALNAQDSDAIRRLAPVAAADAEKVGALGEALRNWELAVEYADGAPAEEMAELYQKIAWCLSLTGRISEALKFQDLALQLIDSQDMRCLGAAQIRMSRYQWQYSNGAEAIRFAGLAIESLKHRGGPELARAFSNRAQLAMVAYDFEVAESMANKALSLAKIHNRQDIRCHALNNLGMAKNWSDPETGRRLLAESLRTALQIGSLDNAARAYGNSVYFEYRQHKFPRVLELAEEGLAYAAANQLDVYQRYLQGTVSLVHLLLGDWEAAERLATESLDRQYEGGEFVHNLLPANVTLARLEMRRGTGGESRNIDHLLKYAGRTKELQRLVQVCAIVAEKAWLDGGNYSHAIEYIEPIIDNTDPCFVAEALVWLKRLKPRLRANVSDNMMPADRLQLDGNFESAAAIWLDLGSEFEAAMALASGDTAARRRAVEMLDRLGAHASSRRIRDQLRSRGESVPEPRLSTRKNPAGLTRRQMDVLRLLRDGLSNTQIGEKLYVSPKTVDHHVSAILAKLDASSRGEAVATALKRNLIEE